MFSQSTSQFDLPPLPAPIPSFLTHLASHPETPVPKLLEPYKAYESVLRKIYAQEPSHPSLASNPGINLVPLFPITKDKKGYEGDSRVGIRARDLENETCEEKEAYIMELGKEERKGNGERAWVEDLAEFRGNFGLFSESSLSELDWRNIVVAGSAVTVWKLYSFLTKD